MPATKSTSNVNTMPAEKKTSPKTEKAAAAPKTTKKAAAEVTVPTTTTPAPATVAPVTAPATTETAAVRSSADILTALQETLKTLQADVTTRVRAAVHDAQEAIKAVKREAREGKRRRRKDPSEMTPEEKAAWEARRANNAFLKPRPLSDELATFMGLPAKSQKSQTEVTEFVSRYVKSHNCFDPNFKRRISPDAKLAKLLRAKDGEEVTYLNLQKFLKVHFLKPATA